MLYDRTLSISFLISVSIHLLLLAIIPFFLQHPLQKERPKETLEIEVVTLPKQRPIHLRTFSRYLSRPKKRYVSKRVSSFFGRVRDEGRGFGPVFEIPYEKGGNVGYGILEDEVRGVGPIFERVERGVVWGKGPITTSDLLHKGEPSGEDALVKAPFKHRPLLEERLLGEEESEEKGASRYHIEGPVTKRAILYQPEIPLLESVKREGVSLRARFKFWVHPSGRVYRVEKIETFGYPDQDDEALKTIRRWIFSKGEEEAWGIVSIRIQLN